MYTMVMMMAATSGGDTTGFGGLRGGCHGSTCHGAPVVMAAPAGCTGVVHSGCTGNSCGGGGFLGLRNRDRGNGCDGGGFLGLRNKGGSCHGGSGCIGSSCHGAVYVAPAPTCAPTCAPAPTCGGCGVPTCGGCGTTPMSVPMGGMVMGGTMMGNPMGCPPGVVIMGSGTVPLTGAAEMPKPMGEPKKDEPKKDEPKKMD